MHAPILNTNPIIIRTGFTIPMIVLSRIFLIAAVIIFAPLSASGQVLWGKAHLGITPPEVLHLYPSAETVSDGRILPGGQKELLRLPFVAMGDIPSTVHFFFQSGRLHTVGWRLSPQGDFIEIAPRYEELLQGLTKEHPASQRIKSKRQLNMARFLNNEWTTVEGVRINISMFDAIESIPVWISVQTSGDGGAWLRMESNDRRLAQEYRNTQQLATIRARKDAEEKSYNKFLDSLVGKDIAQLASKWGAPTGTTGLPNGEVIYVWDIRSGDWQCRTSIFTMVNGKITKWQWSGNNCRVISE